VILGGFAIANPLDSRVAEAKPFCPAYRQAGDWQAACRRQACLPQVGLPAAGRENFAGPVVYFDTGFFLDVFLIQRGWFSCQI